MRFSPCCKDNEAMGHLHVHGCSTTVSRFFCIALLQLPLGGGPLVFHGVYLGLAHVGRTDCAYQVDRPADLFGILCNFLMQKKKVSTSLRPIHCASGYHPVFLIATKRQS